MKSTTKTTIDPDAHTTNSDASITEIKQCLDHLLQWYEALQPDSLEHIHNFYASSAHFRDPFNKVQGRSQIKQIFQHMFATLESPRFTIQDRVLEGQKAFLTWDFQFRKSNKDYLIHGGSFLQFDSAGLVVSHRDYWDSAEELLQKLPLIGIPLRWLKRRISVRTEVHPS